MKKINIKNIEYNLNLVVLTLIAPIGYFVPIAEWLLLSMLACFSLFKYSINYHKINYSYLIPFICICLVFLNSYFFSTIPSRTLEVLGPKIGIIFAILVVLILTSKNNISDMSKLLGLSIFTVSIIIFCDLILNTEIRATLASFVGDKPSSLSANYSRGILILAAIMPITIALLFNKKKYLYGIALLLLITSIIIIGPNDTAKISLICSLFASLIIYFLGPKSFISFGIVAALFILFLPILSIKLFPKIGNFEKQIEYPIKCEKLREWQIPIYTKKADSINCFITLPWQESSTGGSLIHRILVWQFVGKEIIKKPIFGYGLGTSRLIGQNIILHVPNTKLEIKGGIPLHPHNNFLEIWLELGIIGISALLYVWYKIIKLGYYIRKKSFILGTGACTSIISMFIICNLSFGLFQAWWMSLICLVFLSIIQACKNNEV